MFTSTNHTHFFPETAPLKATTKSKLHPAVQRFYSKHPILVLTTAGRIARRDPDAVAMLDIRQDGEHFYLVGKFAGQCDEWRTICSHGSFFSALRTWLYLHGIARKGEWHSRVLPELQLLAITASAMTAQSGLAYQYVAELRAALSFVPVP